MTALSIYTHTKLNNSIYMKRTIIGICLAAMTAGANAQTLVTDFTPGIAANGVNYMLPKTQLKVAVSAMKVTYTQGEYSQYAERYLNIDGTADMDKAGWTVTGIRIWQEGEPDSTKTYTVKLKDKTVAPLVQLTAEGVLLAVNTETEEKEVSIANDKTTHNKLDAGQYLTEEILSATSLAKRAELTAQEILDIRESKNAIKRGLVESMPKDGASLKIVLGELDRQERALTQLYVGYCDTLTTERVFTFTPEGDIDRNVLFRFSRKLGFVDSDDLAGEPFYLTIKDKHTVVLPTEEEKAKRKIMGLVYNMPSTAQVKLESMDKVVYANDLPFAQFGTVDMLSPSLFNKGATTKLVLHPATGGIMHLSQ